MLPEKRISQMRKYYAGNRDKVQATQKKWRAAHLKEKKAYDKARRETNREKKRAYDIMYRGANREKMKAYQKKYHVENFEQIKVQDRKHREANRDNNYARLVEVFGASCADCGGVWPMQIYDYHHIDPSTKVGKINIHNWQWPRVKAYVRGCVQLCPTCHRMRHYLLRRGVK
jgi:hypothetical protein